MNFHKNEQNCLVQSKVIISRRVYISCNKQEKRDELDSKYLLRACGYSGLGAVHRQGDGFNHVILFNRGEFALNKVNKNKDKSARGNK